MTFFSSIQSLRHSLKERHSCLFPKQVGLGAQFLLKRFFSGVKIAPAHIEALRAIPDNAIVVYVIKYRSRFAQLFYYTRYRSEDLPFPTLALDQKFYFLQPIFRLVQIALFHSVYLLSHRHRADPFQSGYVRDKLAKGHCGFLGLVERKELYQRFVKERPDPLAHLIRIQREMQRPVYLVPQLLFFGKKPPTSKVRLGDLLFGSQQQPRTLRRLVTLFRKPDSIFSEVSQPLVLSEFLDRKAHRGRSGRHLALILRRDLLAQINAHRQSITGPVVKSPDELRQRILTGERLQAYIQKYAQRRKISLHQAHKEALGYLDEIAARYNPDVIQVCALLARRFLDYWFDEISINVAGLQRAKEMARQGPLILIPCHKSNLDSLLLAYALYTHNMPCPHMFAGKNLSFWPVGPLLRRVGAFFVRRSFRGAVFYSKVFSEYIFRLLHEGTNIGVYIEGGRSRIGKLVPPQLGMLSILMKAFFDGACRDMIFVPVFMGYDRIPEERSYLHETGGGEKRPESLVEMLRSRKLLKNRFGKFYLRFHEPIALSQLLDQNDIDHSRPSAKTQNALCRQLGYRILSAIDGDSVVTPQSLMAAAILNSAREIVRVDQLLDQVDIYLGHLVSRRVEVATELLIDPHYTLQIILKDYVRRKFILPAHKKGGYGQTDAVFRVNTSKRSALEYYKNNSISHFVPAAFTALAILGEESFQFSASTLSRDYAFLRELFQFEFFNAAEETSEYLVRKSVKVLIDDGTLVPHRSLPDTYRLTSPGYRRLVLFASFLKSLFEAYWVVLCYYRQTARAKDVKNERLKKIQALGYRMHKHQEIDRIEAVSLPVLGNADNYCAGKGIKGREDSQLIDPLEARIKGFMVYLPWR